ncbi:RNA polymerase sigma factor [Phenylobacterium sp.]|uniref:RNA polymerase sigma factor n=1 Tax=Phenylobacterium sp. TaxID=1871053 RepID=UPI002E31CE84|nr:sigma-70 family RNA polymerase sigma factor [Phenylobacterium sp.]HEX2561062.1 sigma-70 family RNA polymerase sigma factor [Phenylobacterium sp.]
MELNAFQREMVELLPRLRRLARAVARDPADADDLVQLTVERALSRAGQWTPGTRLDSWMFRIMKNAWIDEHRARGRRGQVLAPEEEGLAVGDAGAEAAEMRLQAAEVRREMARLPDDQRLAVALVLVDGLSYREAADILEIPMGTLTSRLVRGRTALLARLNPQESAA